MDNQRLTSEAAEAQGREATRSEAQTTTGRAGPGTQGVLGPSLLQPVPRDWVNLHAQRGAELSGRLPSNTTYTHPLYWCPVVAAVNSHDLGGLKSHQCVLSWFWKSEGQNPPRGSCWRIRSRPPSTFKGLPAFPACGPPFWSGITPTSASVITACPSRL